MQELGTLRHDVPQVASKAVEATYVECTVVEPEPVHSSSETEAFFICQRAPVHEVVLPLLDRVDRLPFSRHLAYLQDLFEERIGHGRLAV